MWGANRLECRLALNTAAKFRSFVWTATRTAGPRAFYSDALGDDAVAWQGQAAHLLQKRQRPAAQSRRDGDDEVDSGEDSGDEEAAQHARLMAEEDDEAEKEAAEPAAERRVRLAKEMIAAMDAAHSRDGHARRPARVAMWSPKRSRRMLFGEPGAGGTARPLRCAARASLPRIFAGYAARASARRASRSRRTRALLSAAARMVRWSMEPSEREGDQAAWRARGCVPRGRRRRGRIAGCGGGEQ